MPFELHIIIIRMMNVNIFFDLISAANINNWLEFRRIMENCKVAQLFIVNNGICWLSLIWSFHKIWMYSNLIICFKLSTFKVFNRKYRNGYAFISVYVSWLHVWYFLVFCYVWNQQLNRMVFSSSPLKYWMRQTMKNKI